MKIPKAHNKEPIPAETTTAVIILLNFSRFISSSFYELLKANDGGSGVVDEDVYEVALLLEKELQWLIGKVRELLILSQNHDFLLYKISLSSIQAKF